MLIRKASLTDSETIYDLVNYYANKGLMLSRSRSSIYEYIRNYSVMEINGQVVGIGALSIFWSDSDNRIFLVSGMAISVTPIVTAPLVA